MAPFINIHTHHLSKDNGVFLFNNRFNHDKDYFSEKYYSIGIHPWDSDIEISFTEFEKLIKDANCLAIGECGLDKLKGPNIETQKQVLILQLELAIKYNKPVIIHCVKAFDELIKICKSYLNKITIIIHGYNKNSELAKQLISIGFYLSLPLNFVIHNDVIELDLNKLFFETDDKKNNSIQTVYGTFARKYNYDLESLKAKINLNFTTVFGINL